MRIVSFCQSLGLLLSLLGGAGHWRAQPLAPAPPAAAAWLSAGRAPKFERLSTEQGLSQNTVLCALQDRQGFMWFGTQDGLNRFDGYGFTIYRHDEADPGSLRDNYILSLYEDRAGVLWVGTNKGGLNRYDRQRERFTAYVHDPKDAESLSLNAVTAIVEDRAGYLWVATDGQGVNRFDRRTGKFKRFINDPAAPENRRLNIVLDLYLDQVGTLWLGTSLGLSGMNLQSYEVKRYTHDPDDPQSLSHNRVQTITADRAGTLWLGTLEGLNRFDRGSGRFTRFRHDPANPNSPAHNNIEIAYSDRQGRLWLGTSQGLDRFDAATGRFTHQVADPGAPHGLSGNNIHVVYEDRAGSFWVAAQDAGLNRYDAQAKPFVNFAHDPKNPQSLSHNSVRAFFGDRAGRLLVGAYNGVNQFDPATRQFSLLPLVAPKQPAGSAPRVLAFAEDRAGRLWLGAGSGLFRLERPPNGAMRTRYFGASHPVLTVCVARDGMIWVGTHGGGLLRFDPATEQITAFLNDPQNLQSLSDNLVYAISEDRDGFLWIGSNQGLNRLDRATGQFTRFLHDPQNPASLSYNLVWSIYEDRGGRLWIGTGGGLNLFDRRTQQFSRFTEKDGLPNANVIGILEDARGQLWLGTIKGLARFDPQTKTCRNYDRTDGLFGNEIAQGAYYQNRQGVLFFGGPEGFSAFQPEQIQDDLTPPPIVLTACHRYNTDAAEGIALVEKGIAARSAIEFSYKDNILTFEFAALSFRHPEKNQYAYQLAGYSDRWIQLGTKRDVTFTNLNAGDYTLRVRGSNSDGVWNMTGTSLRIGITPPFWRRWWFVGLELLTVAGLALGAYRWRIAALQRRNARQQEFARQLIESQEAERKRIAAELHDSLGQNLLIIKNRALLGQLAAESKLSGPEFQEQFEGIAASATQSIEEVREIAQNLRPYHLDRLGLTEALEAMIEKVAASTTIRFVPELVPLDGLFTKEAAITLYRVVQESLNNIVKHAQASEARISIERQSDSVTITIRDNGRGFAPKTASAKPGGFGLAGMAERVRMLGGELTIHSVTGQGATVTVRIELKNK
ncbi:MAG: ligand-binding sensor domain-containing protein [Blastocatellia bacterium]